jgi:hypothetical protein
MNSRLTVVPRTVTAAALIVAALTIGASCAQSGSDASSSTTSEPAKPNPPAWVLHGAYAPAIDPADFVATVDNPYFPLPPGTAFHFEGTADGAPQTDDAVVTDQQKTVLGIACTVVEDTVSEGGKAIERTFDWYAQDKARNVWYMGEASYERHNGRFVRASDSWEAGVHGAQPGIIMPGNPQTGAVYRQEYLPPDALDQAHVVATDAHKEVKYGSFANVLVTDEWSPVEPQIEQKSYVAGVGEIEEHVTAGGYEQFELVRVTRA